MITFAIVEDEPLEREAMVEFLQKNFPDDRVIWQAENGKAALEYFAESQPDILITDIEMPVINGLMLCKALNEQHYPGVILISTAYDSFAYARQAIRYQVFDYITKPMEDEELRLSVQNAVAEARRRRENRSQEKMKNYAFSILRSASGEQRTADDFFRVMGWPMEGVQASVSHLLFARPVSEREMRAISAWKQQIEEQGVFVFADFTQPQELVFIVQPMQERTVSMWYTQILMIRDMLSTLRPEKWVKHAVCSTYEEALLACTEGADEEEILPGWQYMHKKEAQRCANLCERYLREKNRTKVLHMLKGEEDLLWEILRIIFEKLRIIWPAADLQRTIFSALHVEADPSKTAEKMVDLCLEMPESAGENLISQILDWMENDFNKDITQSIVAERFGMDPAYFSRFFKKSMGKNFSQVLTDIRMKHAETIIRENPSVSLDELCAACGLTSRSYFSEAFKKWKGMTVTQYIEQIKRS